jgi:hypothetical protein
VNPGQNYLLKTTGCKYLYLLHNIRTWNRTASAPGVRDNAVGAEIVTAGLNLHKGTAMPGKAPDFKGGAILGLRNVAYIDAWT